MSVFEEEWVTGPQSTDFYTRLWPAHAPKALLVFVHGFAEHIGRSAAAASAVRRPTSLKPHRRYEHVFPAWVQRGFSVFAFDQRGFGLTAMGDRAHVSKESKYGKTSWDAQFRDIEWWLKYVRDQFPGVPVFLMGHSMVRVLSCVCCWSVSEGTGFTRVVGWLLASRHVQSLHLLRTVSHSYRA